MIRLGLTGSIGMGKSTTAKMFEAEGASVYDADAAVHALYAKGGAAVADVEAAFPGVASAGFVDRTALGQRVLDNPQALATLERIVHPLVARDRQDFFQRNADASVVVLDVPLLFETGGDKFVDAIVVVSASADIQRRRVLERPGMSEQKLDAILARQAPDSEKRRRADFVIDTGRGLEHAQAEVRSIMAVLRNPQWRSKRSLDPARDAAQ